MTLEENNFGVKSMTRGIYFDEHHASRHAGDPGATSNARAFSLPCNMLKKQKI
jgi:hypothetical protein